MAKNKRLNFRLLTSLLTALFFPMAPAMAGGGYTWMGSLAHQLHISQHVIVFSLVATCILLVGLMYRIKVNRLEAVGAALIPDSKITLRNVFEFFGSSLYNLGKEVMGEKIIRDYFTFVCATFLIVFLNNVIGLIPGFLPPTEDLNITLALGSFVFIFYNIQGIRVQGLWGHIKHFLGPVWYLAWLIGMIEIISHFVRPISLGLRLRGNMTGDHMVLATFSDLAPLGVPIVFLFIGLFVCFMQAFVFTLLTMVYIKLATEHHDHGDH